ncbi:hypothetical protein C8Q79DRAFT_926435 [Trametes meyenii]|nr:hypothetical protein C8Q79DRAFT_926435 [Trametes meyenii]
MDTLSSEDIVDAYYWTYIGRIAYFVPMTIICYDFLLTLGRERQHIWRRGFSRSVLLFYAARYSALSNAPFVVIDLTHWPTMSDSSKSISCGIITRVQMVLDIVLLVASGVFSALRVYALSGRKLWLLVTIMSLALVNPAIVIRTFADMAISSYILDGTDLRACSYYSQMPDIAYEKPPKFLTMIEGLAGARLSNVLVDLVVLLITWARMWPATREAASLNFTSKFASVFMRDGTMYFLVFDLLEPSSTWISAVTAVMTVRFILDLHEADNARRAGTSGLTAQSCQDVSIGAIPSFSNSLRNTRALGNTVYDAMIITMHDEEPESGECRLLGLINIIRVVNIFPAAALLCVIWKCEISVDVAVTILLSQLWSLFLLAYGAHLHKSTLRYHGGFVFWSDY